MWLMMSVFMYSCVCVFISLCVFRARKIPIIIRRYLPDHTPTHPSFEDWDVNELTVDQ
eukprot:m.130572 g.130572  ORF g.130572 m.130572 type:complete len:58 (-) comp52350_c0_seq10:91-264(-)